MQIKDCPCDSGLRYAACCKPFHERAAKPPTPEALMRSRYSGFVLGKGAYLYDTLAADHPDRQSTPEEEEMAMVILSRMKDTQRFMGLTIVHAEGNEVLFVAKIFEQGKDLSFAELSDFVKEDGSWKYASGIILPANKLPPKEGLNRESFLAAANASAAPSS
jgi:SEC-C motif domain protein